MLNSLIGFAVGALVVGGFWVRSIWNQPDTNYRTEKKKFKN